MVKKLLLLFTFICIFNNHSFAQGTAGKEFWLTFMDLHIECSNTGYPYTPPPPPKSYYDTCELYITSKTVANIKIIRGNSVFNFKVQPNKVNYIKLDTTWFFPLEQSESDVYSLKGIHITSDSAIQIVAVNSHWQTKGATTLIPVESIPQAPEYIISANQSSQSWACYGAQPPVYSGEFAIVGIAPVSKIEVVPLAKSTARYKGSKVPFIINLKAGETFFYVSGDNDLTGSLIRSKDTSSKFSVFAGNRKSGSSQLGANGKACINGDDHGFEQMLPIVYWGKSYTALPYKNLKGGYFLKVLASQKNTIVNINGLYYATLNEGEHFLYNLTTDTVVRITANRSISVTQFSKGTICGQHTLPKSALGDLSQLELVPDNEWGKGATVHKVSNKPNYWGSPSSWYAPADYVNVLVRTMDTGIFYINNKKINLNSWKTSSLMTGYHYAQLILDSSIKYNLSCSNGMIAYVYGYAANEGYAYTAGANFKPQHSNFIYSQVCYLDATKFTALNTDSFSYVKWMFGDNTAIDSGLRVTHTYTDTGWFNVVMYGKNKFTNAMDSVQKRIHMAPSGHRPLIFNDTIVCGKLDINFYMKDFDMDNSYLWSNGHPNYYFAFKDTGTYWVKVKERNECVSFDTVRIANAPFPVSSFDISDSVFCANSIKPITFTNNSTSIDPIKQMQWDFGDQNVNDTHKIVKHLYTKADLYYVSLKITTVKGCVKDTFKLIDVKKAPNAQFEMDKTDSCLGSNLITFTNTTAIDSTLHMRYKWHFSDSFVISNSDPSGPKKMLLGGNQYAELIYENWNGCIDTLRKDIIIYTPPKPAFTFASNFGCQNDSVRITNNSTGIYKPVNSKWYFGDNTSSTVHSPSHLYSKKGKYNVKLVVSIPQGCKDSLTLPVTVYGAPKVDFTINRDIQCLKDNLFKCINTSTTDTGNITAVKWTYSDGGIDLNTDTVYRQFTAAGNPTIKLKVTGIFGCSDSLTKIVQVKAAPLAQFSINSKSQCLKTENFTFTYLSPPGNDSIKNITWYYYTDSAKNAASLSNIKFPYIGSYTVKLKLKSKFDCEGESSTLVFVNPNPVVGFKVPKPLQCLKGNAFTPVHTAGVSKGAVTGFNWDFGDMTSSLQEFPAPKTYTKSGDYKVILTAYTDSGCSDTFSSVVRVRASADITIDPVTETCLNDTTTLNGSAVLSDGFIRKYKWEFGDTKMTDTLSFSKAKHLYPKVGTYNVTLTTISNYGCVDSKTANAWVTVNPLPNAAFRYEIKDGGNHNSLMSVTDLTQPKPVKLRWDFGPYGSSRKSDTSISIIDTTTVRARLYVTDSKGCTGWIEKSVFVAPPGEMYFPNAFTANGDGLNDGFGPQGIMYATNYKFTIYNRWGEIVFKSTALGETWNGSYQDKPCPNGVYIYKMELNDFYGKYKSFEGSVLLMW